MSDQPNMDELRAEILETRHELADTVDQLTEKFDVKAQASKKAHAVAETASDKAHEVAQKVQPAIDTVQRNRRPALAITAALTVGLIVLIFRSRRDS